jgi:hypothetical protein
MRIGRTALIPVILALSVAGSVLASSGMAAAAVLAPNATVHQATAVTGTAHMKYHG